MMNKKLMYKDVGFKPFTIFHNMILVVWLLLGLFLAILGAKVSVIFGAIIFLLFVFIMSGTMIAWGVERRVLDNE